MSSDLAVGAIRVTGVSKRYVLGARRPGATTLREQFAGALTAWRRGTAPAETLWALQDVTFDVSPGEILGVIGGNGAGKSTLLKILSRITQPTRGRAELRGRVGSLLEVGTGFHPELSGRDNIYLNGAILGMPRAEIERKLDEIVAFAEVEAFIDTPVKRYSSGMYLRLAFAVAAHLEPEILLVDEVLAVGDAAFQRKCLGKMGDVARQGRTILFVSHNLAAVQSLCPRVLLLAAGRIAFDGEARQAISQYLERGLDSPTQRGIYVVHSERLAAGSTAAVSISDVQLLTAAGTALPSLETGDALLIRIFYDAHRRLQAPAFIVSLKDDYDVEIARLSTMPVSGFFIESLQGAGYVDLLLESLPLLGGQYHLDLGLARPNIEFLTLILRAVSFQVAAVDVYRSGLALDRSRGLIALAHRWHLVPAEMQPQPEGRAPQ
jgi:lipopolysaccharide transport system ATP-binding protein